MDSMTARDSARVFIHMNYTTYYYLIALFFSDILCRFVVPDEKQDVKWRRRVDDFFWKILLGPLDKRHYTLMAKWSDRYLMYGELPPKRCLHSR